jgi:phosphoglycolate phosphatase-like HAD superfamily hydrolase
MNIAFDLDGTLIAECGEFRCTRQGDLAHLIFPHALRVGARELLCELHRAGHKITLYTLSDRAPLRLWLWLRLQGVPVRRVITGRSHAKKLPQHATKWPPTFGIDLLCDDNPKQVESAQRSGCSAILVTNRKDDWAEEIRQACLEQSRCKRFASPLPVH